MSLRFDQRDGVLILRVGQNDLKPDALDASKNALLERLRGAQLAAIDMSGVRTMTGAGLTLLVLVLGALGEWRSRTGLSAEGGLRLFGLQPRVEGFLRMSRLEEVFPADSDEETCLAALAPEDETRMAA
jgi:anti-anti-sigma regulatory factor